MDVSQCEAVISEDASVVVDAEGKIAEHHAIHHVLFAVEAVYVSGRFSFTPGLSRGRSAISFVAT
jgi:hypothetical protein